MGRKRVYGNDAERVAAWRKRKRDREYEEYCREQRELETLRSKLVVSADQQSSIMFDTLSKKCSPEWLEAVNCQVRHIKEEYVKRGILREKGIK